MPNYTRITKQHNITNGLEFDDMTDAHDRLKTERDAVLQRYMRVVLWLEKGHKGYEETVVAEGSFSSLLDALIEKAIAYGDARVIAEPCRHDWRVVLEHLSMGRALRESRYGGGNPNWHINTGCAICDTARAEMTP